MTEVVNSQNGIEMKCIVARLDHGDDIAWSDIMDDNIMPGGTMLSLGTVGILHISMDGSVFLFTKDDFIYIGNSETLRKQLAFVKFLHDAERNVPMLNMDLIMDGMQVDASYVISSFVHNTFTISGIPVGTPLTLAIELKGGENWRIFTECLAKADYQEPHLSKLNIIEYGVDNAVLVTPGATSIWVLHDEQIIYIGTQEEFDRSTEFLSLDKEHKLCCVNNRSFDISVPYEVVLEELN